MRVKKELVRSDFVVYEIRCIATGKVYIGSTKNHRERWYRHRHALIRGVHHSSRLQAAWVAHGANAFETTVIACALTLADLIPLEQQLIDQTGAAKQKRGFNCAHIADRPFMTHEIRAKMCASQRKRGPRTPHSTETRRRISVAKLGKPFSEAHCQSLSMVRMGKPTKATEEVRSRILDLKASGLSNRAIGRVVGVCHHTVKSVTPTAADWRSSSEGSAWLSAHAKRTWATRHKVAVICHKCGGPFTSYYPNKAKWWCSTRCKNAAVKDNQRVTVAA